MKTKIYNISIIVLAMTFLSCDDILEPEPIGAGVVDNIYIDEAGALTGINAAYNPLTNLYGFGIMQLVDSASDDLYSWRAGAVYQDFTSNSADPLGENFWEQSYIGINTCNTVISRVPQISFVANPELKDVVLGQAYFLRAIYYYNLVRLFGDVPILLEETTTLEEATKERSSTDVVYNQIIEDLSISADLLPTVGALTGGTGLEKGRATKGAAYTTLASVHLTLENWSSAVAEAQKVIDSGEYSLFENYADNFYGTNENGMESIFEVQYGLQGSPSSPLNTGFGHPSLVQGNGLYGLVATSDVLDTGSPGAIGGGIGLVEAFESGDTRFATTISYYDFEESVIAPPADPDPLINKYFVGTAFPANASPVNVPIFRYSEVLLIKAEALNELTANSMDAIDIINSIRNRAGLDSLPTEVTSNQVNFREAIWKERRTELAVEAKRFFDLNRTGRLAERVALQEIIINSARLTAHPITGKEQYLYGIPFSEISTNPLMTQNPGY